ncbi:N-acetylmuramoyl-L-alanine amidase [Paenibacillus sp. Marseille-Q4541]|uniref:N-acetylmuramoyl-L-alanine amidase family protein n=1 Tax=Paenibacillus sp. Marseille-Q4541 TaxID=2831522 RepID=UPI002018A2D0|nr:N-acetylmuramoyl-L-alanine amidase [Paenibacillus sp. Marseille-Q4541]
MIASAAPAEQNHNQNEHVSHAAFRHPVIIIDAGHGGIDGGTSADDLLEKDINLSISRKMYMMLKSKGYAVVLNRNEDYALSDDNTWLKSRSRHLKDLAQRKELSVEIPSDLIVSVHVNWSKKEHSHGPIVLHQQEGRSYLLAESIQSSLNSMYQTDRQVEWGKPFYLLNYVKKPAVIVEAGFISNSGDREMLSTAAGQKKIAEAISSGIIYYLSVM